MARIGVIAAVLVIAFGVAQTTMGCGSSDDPAAPPTGDQTPPEEGFDFTLTSTDDFDAESMVNLVSVDGTLRLSEKTSTYPFIWIALSARGTICRIDTETGVILGEYRTAPDTVGSSNPSRTTVSLDGSVWAGNRADASVIHVGLMESSQGIDRNGNGVIDTSTGYGDVRPWPNPGGVDDAGGVTTAEDELILHYVKTTATATRHVSVDADNNLWVSGIFGSDDHTFNYIDGVTGAILRTEGPFTDGGYGGLIDGAGVIWSASSGGDVLRWNPDAPLNPGVNPLTINIPNYGMAIDSTGHVWVSNLSTDTVRKLAPDGTVVATYSYVAQGDGAQGLAVDPDDHVWISASLSGGDTLTHLLPDGTFLGNVTGVGDGSTGVAVDSAGKIWTANINDSNASRIDPTAGPLGSDGVTPIGQVDLTVDLPGANPYNYSDMTGALALSSTSVQGTLTVTLDSTVDGAGWGTLSWNHEAEALLPPDTEIAVEARAAETVVGLGAETYVDVESGVPFSLTGRFLQFRVTLKASPTGESPVLSDVCIDLAE